MKPSLATPLDVDQFLDGALPPLFSRPSQEMELQHWRGPQFIANPCLADRDHPAFDRAAMDGIAVRTSSRGFEKDHEWKSLALLTAGQDPSPHSNVLPGEGSFCLEIMTGASLPTGYDRVIPIELLSRQERPAGVFFSLRETLEPSSKHNIHFQGSDIRAGGTSLPAGRLVDGPSAGILATFGVSNAVVVMPPSIAILSTGDELVTPDATPEPWQIRSSHHSALKTELSAWGLGSEVFPLAPDDRVMIEELLLEALEKHAIVVMTGGVSMGRTDYVPGILSSLGFDLAIHGVAQRPGKPLVAASGQGKIVFGLPGNPVSALVCLRRYLIPAMLKNLSHRHNFLRTQAEGFMVDLENPVRSDKRLTMFRLTAIHRQEDGTMKAALVDSNGSGDIVSLGKSAGFVAIEPGEDFKERELFFPWGC